MSIDGAKKSRGRPRVDTEAVNVRMPANMIDAIDGFRGSHAETNSRPEAIRYILRDWLTGHGLLRHREDPEGAN